MSVPLRSSVPRSASLLALLAAVALAAPLSTAVAQRDAAPAPNRAEGEGPFDRLIIRGVTLIDGTGGPPRGPVDIVVERNRIAQIVDIGSPGLPVNEARRPKGPAACPRRLKPNTCTSCGWPMA
jgi:hypothetical protein